MSKKSFNTTTTYNDERFECMDCFIPLLGWGDQDDKSLDQADESAVITLVGGVDADDEYLILDGAHAAFIVV